MKKKAAVFLAALLLTLCGCANNKLPEPEISSSETNTSEKTTVTEAAPDDTTVTEAVPDDTTVTEAVPDEISESAAKDIIIDLLERSEFIINKLSKCAVNADYDGVVDVGELQYAPLSEEYGFTCVDDVKKYVLDTYTKAFYDDSYLNALFEGDYRMLTDIDGKLYINVSGGGGGGNIWAYDTMTFSELTGNRISATVEGQDMYESTEKVNVTVKLVDGTWLIDICEIEYYE